MSSILLLFRTNNMPYVIKYKLFFHTFNKEIVETLINGYQEGITPLPCSRCNRAVKFSEMINWAE